MMTVGSLFAGIGGFDLGFQRAGFEIAWQVEIDPFCRAVLARHFPSAERYGDVKDCGAHTLATVDVLCGGFPCQPHSLAGKRAGAADTRNLWPDFARLIRELKPRWIVAENVPGLLSSNAGRFYGTILRDLAACGYDAEWDCLPASAFGAPHRRDRVWVVAYPQHVRCTAGQDATGIGQQGPQWPLGSGTKYGELTRCGDVAYPSRAGRQQVTGGAHGDEGTHEGRPALHGHVITGGRQDVADTGCLGTQGSAPRVFTAEQKKPERDSLWSVEPNVGRVAHGIPDRVDRLRGLGNAIVPQIAEWIARAILDAEGVQG